MNEQIDILNLLKDKSALLKYILGMIASSDKFSRNIPLLRERGWSEQGMLDKVLEVTAIQSAQIKHLALVSLLLVQSDDFDAMVGKLMVKMGRGDEALRAMFESKLAK